MLCRFSVLVAVALLGPLGLFGFARAADNAFPFGTELMLDVEPLYGSKRIPMIEIEDNGAAAIGLWCSSVHASATVGEIPSPSSPSRRSRRNARRNARAATKRCWRRCRR